MAGIEPKMLSTMRVYDILFKYSDEKHPMTQADIIDKLESEYGITLDRKAVARKLSALKEIGHEIQQTRKGSYLKQRLFEDSELHLLIDMVRGNPIISPRHANDLIEKLSSLSSVYFKPRISLTQTMGAEKKGDNPALFLNVDLIYEAISTGKQIKYDYNLYGSDKKLHRSSEQIVSPYQLFFHMQAYYLMAYSETKEHISFHRIERITNLQIVDKAITQINKIKGYEKGLPQNFYTAARPYMFSDKPERIELLINDDKYPINQLVEWFGKDITIKKSDEHPGHYEVSLIASPKAMKLWALQYADHVVIKGPPELADSVIESLDYAINHYEDEY